MTLPGITWQEDNKMAISQALAAGRANAIRYDPGALGNPYQVVPMLREMAARGRVAPQLPGLFGASRVIRGGRSSAGRAVGRPSAADIAEGAAELSLKQREMDIREREMAVKEREAIESEREGINTRYQERMNQAQARYMKDVAFPQEMAIKGRAQDVAERAQTEAEAAGAYTREKGRKETTMKENEQELRKDYSIAQWGLANKNKDAILQFFDKHGDENSYIDDIQFSPPISYDEMGNPIPNPDDPDGMLVYYTGQKDPQYFANRGEFMQGLMGWVAPDVLKEMVKYNAKTAKGGITEKDLLKLRQDALKQYKSDPDVYNVAGEKREGAPDFETYAKDYIANVTGTQPAPEQEEAKAGAEEGAEKTKTSRRNYKTMRDPNTGYTVRKYADGSYELFDNQGRLMKRRYPDGREETYVARGAIQGNR